MGRRDAVAVTLEFVAEWRRLGARVTFEPGWESRGNGTSANYEGAVVHHTASHSSASNPSPTTRLLINGRVDLSGPLCNSQGPWCTEDDPWIHVIAAHPSNNAGASGGRNTAPYPVTRLFNPLVWGHEIDYPGSSPMTAGQRKAALIMARGVINVLRKDPSWVKAHAETSVTGKWDPGYAPGRPIDMVAFRSDVAALIEGDDMPWTQKQIEDFVYGAVRNLFLDMNNGDNDYAKQPFQSVVAGAVAPQISALRAEVAALRAGEEIDVEELSLRVAEHTSAKILATLLDEIESTVREVMGEDDAEQADELITRLGARLQAVAPAT